MYVLLFYHMFPTCSQSAENWWSVPHQVHSGRCRCRRRHMMIQDMRAKRAIAVWGLCCSLCWCNFRCRRWPPWIGAKWEGMPYHVTLGRPGWWIKAAQVEVGWCSCLLVFLAFLALANAVIIGTCCWDSWCPLPHNMRKWSQAHMLFLFPHVYPCACVCLCVYVCAYVFW